MSDNPNRSFRRAFARRSVELMAQRGSFERGWAYAAEGRVGKLTVTASSVHAKVRGSTWYHVRLWLDEEDEPTYDCSCPVGGGGRLCKHGVAVALVSTDADADSKEPAQTEIDVRSYLQGLDHTALVDLLVARAAADSTFDTRLRMAAARSNNGPPQLAAFRDAIDEAFHVYGYVEYQDMYDYAAGVDSVLDSLQDLLDDGHAEEVITLSEQAMDRAEEALGYVDDSDGSMSNIAERLQTLHHAACLSAEPNPVGLAQTLFDRERHSGDLEFFYGAAATYAELLGPSGLAEYRRLAQAEWDALPPLGPEGRDRSWSSRFRITTIMHTLAKLTGDVDEVVDVLAHDQSSAYQFVRIAEVLRGAGRYDDALAWAEKGLALHGGSDGRLVDVAAEEYHRSGRGDEAVRVAWDAYNQTPKLGTYQKLTEQAQRADLWPAWHDRALELLRSRIGSGSKQRQAPSRERTLRWPGAAPDSSTLVEVLLFDGDVEQAWAEANVAGCRRELWLELARRREGDHPLEAIPIWQDEVERRIGMKNNHAYADAVHLIARVGQLMSSADRDVDFAPYLAALRTRHKPKRNLMKLFAERSW